MKILVSGGSGFIGKRLVSDLKTSGHQVISLVRHLPTEPSGDIVQWNPSKHQINAPLRTFENLDAVINLAGEPIGKGFWTARKKQAILNSRLDATETLVELAGKLQKPPKTFLSASATGYYGNRGGEILTERSQAGRTFLSQVTQSWENAAKPLQKKGIRLVWLRFGQVLSPEGGILKRLLPFYKKGLGFIFGNGKQYTPWIHLDDASGAIQHVLQHRQTQGPINVVSPTPITQAQFDKFLGNKLNRRLRLKIPAFLIRLFLGEKGEALLLDSTRVKPDLLLKTRYQFKQHHLA